MRLRTVPAALTIGTLAALALAGPAAAQVTVASDGAEAGARAVVLRFTAAAQSRTAGIAALRVALPAGLDGGDVRLTAGPAGWQLRPRDDGFDVSGPALPVGQDARYSIELSQVPEAAQRLAFPTVQRYTDGRADAWVDLDVPTDRAVRPAPVLRLAAATAAAGSTAGQGGGTAAVPRAATGTPMHGLLITLGIGLMLTLVGVVAVIGSRRPARHYRG